MAEPKQPMILVLTANPEDMKTMTPQKALLLAQVTLEHRAYRSAMTIVVPQMFVAFFLTMFGITAHGVLCGILLAGFLNAIIRLLIWWAAKKMAVQL